jgi:hypothetical protein
MVDRSRYVGGHGIQHVDNCLAPKGAGGSACNIRYIWMLSYEYALERNAEFQLWVFSVGHMAPLQLSAVCLFHKDNGL